MRWLPLLWLVACTDPPSSSSPADPTPDAPLADAGPDQLALVGEEVHFVAGPGSRGDFSWTFGDGETAEGREVTHVYDSPGHFQAYLQASGDGPAASDAATVRITWPLADPLPRAAATLVEANGRLFAVMPDFDRIAVVDAADGSVLDHWATCAEPRTLSTDGGTVAVACAADDTVQLRNAISGDLAAEIALPWGSRPYGVVIDGDGETWVTLQGSGAVAHIADGALVEIVEVEPDLRGIAWYGGGLLLTRHRSPDDGGVVLRLDPDSLAIERWSLALDPGPDSDTNARGVPSYLQQIAVRPDGRVAVFPGLKANIERGLARDGLPLSFETTVRSDLRQIALVADEGAVGSEGVKALFDDRGLAVAAAFSPAGDWLFVAQQGMETVDILDPFTMERAGAAAATGTSPDGLWVSADGAALWVSVGLSRELVRFDLASVAVPEETLRVDLLPPGGEVLDPEIWLGKQIFQRSRDPRMSSAGYVSCASCHLDGDHDRRVWDFTDRSEGLRNTIAMKGRAGQAPIHWSANFDEAQDFENDIRGPQQGLGFLSEADWAETSDTLGPSKAGRSAELDALAAYVESLDTFPRSPHRLPDGGLTPDAALGQLIFEDPVVGCTDCHSGPDHTDSAWLGPGLPLLHDVGTLTADSGERMGAPLLGIDTPGLRGVFSSPPYLHDGSAATLMEVLVDRNPADQHGVTSGLSATDLDHLVAWLAQLE